MNIIIFALLITSISIFANEIDCDENPYAKVAKELSLPNCLNTQFKGSKEKICEKCSPIFLSRYTGKSPQLNKEEQQENFVDLALREFKKNITNNLVDVIKFSALPESGAKLSKSIEKCKMKSVEDFAQGCKSPTAIRLLKNSPLFKDLENETANELAQILSTDKPIPGKTLLHRVGKNSCFIPEKKILYLTNTVLEESFNPELIKSLSALDPKKFKTMNDFFLSDEFAENYEGDISELISSLPAHPFLNEIFSSPEKAISFFKEIKSPFSSDNLKEQLYTAKNGDSFDQAMANKCTDSFNALKAAICSEDFEKGNINLSPEENFNKLVNLPLTLGDTELASTEEILENNLNYIKFCPLNNNDKNISLYTSLDNISSNLDAHFKSYSLELFRDRKYELEIGSLRENLCNIKGDCSLDTLVCKAYNKLKVIDSAPDSIDHKLANSINENSKELLRSMIGNTKNADPKTKEILVAHGIIPKDDGSFVKQPEIPERQPDYFAKAAAGVKPQPTQVAQVSPMQAVAPQKPQTRNPASSSFSDNGYANKFDDNIKETPGYSMPDFSDITKNNDELRDIQNEIRRRLSDLDTSSGPNKAQARKVIKDSFASKGRSLSPEQEDFYASQMTEPSPQPTASLPQLHREIASATGPNKAAVSSGDTQLDKWKKAQKEAALMGMAGAQAVSKDDIIANASASQGKELTKVALNIAEDPRVTLSDVLNTKLNQNDPETQLLKVLLKNKNNFVLQVKSVNFKVIFDEKQNFNILLESGDKNEAERMRPQLEMFLKKLRV